MPDNIQPMLASTGELPTDIARWALEVKWDGVRAIVYVSDGRVRVVGRRGIDATTRYPELQTLADLLHRSLRGGVVRRDLLGQLRVMGDRPALPHEGGERGGEAAAQRAQEGGQAGAGGNLVLLQIGQQDGQDRHEEQRHAEALDQLHHRHVIEVDADEEVRAHEAGRAHHHERDRGE